MLCKLLGCLGLNLTVAVSLGALCNCFSFKVRYQVLSCKLRHPQDNLIPVEGTYNKLVLPVFRSSLAIQHSLKGFCLPYYSYVLSIYSNILAALVVFFDLHAQSGCCLKAQDISLAATVYQCLHRRLLPSLTLCMCSKGHLNLNKVPYALLCLSCPFFSFLLLLFRERYSPKCKLFQF